jgi:hypothetical protein
VACEEPAREQEQDDRHHDARRGEERAHGPGLACRDTTRKDS